MQTRENIVTSLRRKIGARFEMSRGSNLPTVWSNALAATTLAGNAPQPEAWVWTGCALSLYYLGGMFLNDACDRAEDAVERPERPIPRGAVGAREAFGTAFALLFSANLCAWMQGGSGAWWLALTACIVFYDFFHRRNPASPAVMALCRFCACVAAAHAVTPSPPPVVWWAAGLLGAYTIGLSCVARCETSPSIRSRWPLAFLFSPLLWSIPQILEPSHIFFAGLFAGWTAHCAFGLLRHRRPIPIQVGRLIAGMCLWDALVLAVSEQMFAAFAAVGCWALTLAAHRRIAGS